MVSRVAGVGSSNVVSCHAGALCKLATINCFNVIVAEFHFVVSILLLLLLNIVHFIVYFFEYNWRATVIEDVRDGRDWLMIYTLFIVKIFFSLEQSEYSCRSTGNLIIFGDRSGRILMDFINCSFLLT